MAVLDSINVEELIAHLGVPPRRIRLQPPPGQATEDDVIVARPLCELIDGVLVEKAVGFWESRLAVLLAHYVESYLDDNDVGFTLGEGGMQRVAFGQVRLPDLSFYLWSRFPNRELTKNILLEVQPVILLHCRSERLCNSEFSERTKLSRNRRVLQLLEEPKQHLLL